MVKTIPFTNIFNVDADYLVNPVNCRGVPGKGLALEFAHAFPVATKKYIERCYRAPYPIPGDLFYTNTGQVLFTFTKDHWKNPSKIEWIKRSFDNIFREFVFYETPLEIAIPALGCGCGNLRWEEVEEAALLASLEAQYSPHTFIIIKPEGV